VRKTNEDAIALCEPSTTQERSHLGRLYLLCDGAGGHAAGEVASRMATQTIARTYYDRNAFAQPTKEILRLDGSKERHLDGLSSTMDLPLQSIRHAFVTAHKRITQLSALASQYCGMATTCVAAVVKEHMVLIAHIGDSRAYLLRASRDEAPAFIRLTTDHSLVNELIQAGVLTTAQGQASTQRNVLTRMLGGQQESNPLPDITTCHIRAGDQLLLCCDGLWSMMPEEQIEQVVKNHEPQQACDELIRLANAAGGKDNISVIVVSFTG